MTDLTKSARQILYSLYNFAGTTDWAVDLQSFAGETYYDNPGDIDDPPPPTCDGTYSNLEDIEKDKDKIPDQCMSAYLMDALAALLDKGIKDYDDIREYLLTYMPFYRAVDPSLLRWRKPADMLAMRAIVKTDYDEKFGYFADAITQKWKKDLDDFYVRFQAPFIPIRFRCV